MWDQTLRQVKHSPIVRFVDTYVDTAERAAHGFLGEAPGETKSSASPIQRAAAHAVGYATAPLLAGMESIVSNRNRPSSGPTRVARVEPPASLSVSKETGTVSTETGYNDNMSGKSQTKKGKKLQRKPTRKPKKPKKNKMPTRPRPGWKNKGTLVSQPSRPRSKVVSAPATYGVISSMGPIIRFSSGTLPGTLRMENRQHLCSVSIVFDGSGVPTVRFFSGEASNDIGGTLFINPANAFYFREPLVGFSKKFRRWRVKDFCVEYVPRTIAGTQTGYYFTWAYEADPILPDDNAWAASGSAQGWAPTEAQLGQLQCSQQVPAWVPQQCMRPMMRHHDWNYQVADGLDEYVSVVDDVALTRSQYQGFIAIAGDGNRTGSAGTTDKLGDIYVSAVWEYDDLTPPPVTAPGSQLRKQARKLLREHDSKRLDDLVTKLSLEEKSASLRRTKSPPPPTKKNTWVDLGEKPDTDSGPGDFLKSKGR